MEDRDDECNGQRAYIQRLHGACSKLPANAQISSNIELSNLLEIFPKRWKKEKKKRKASAEFTAMHADVL